MERIGIYGGTFNPPHIGHICAANCAVDALGLEKLLLIPSNISPHKALPEGSASAQQRLEMLSIATRNASDRLEVSDIELRRGGTSYTWQTLQQLQQAYPDCERILLMGTDMFLSLESWREPERIFASASIGVFYRGQSQETELIRQQMEKLTAKGVTVYLINNPVNAISSTDLRRMLAFDCADAYLPQDLKAYIIDNALYGTGSSNRQLSETELEKKVTALLNPNRIAHVLGCRDTAVKLARLWGADETDAARAALLHDVTKALPPLLQLTLCREYGIVLDTFSQENPKTLHALTGSLVADRIFGERQSVVDAIRWHTTGKPGMNVLEKIIYVADYMEPNRDFPGVEKLRSLAFSDLDGALKLGLEMTVSLLRQQGRTICPDSQNALNSL